MSGWRKSGGSGRRTSTSTAPPTSGVRSCPDGAGPRGPVRILDLRRHDQAWVRERLGDRWLGFDDDHLKRLLHDAGLAHVRLSVGARRARDPFTVLIASGTKRDHRRITKVTNATKVTK